MAKVQARRSAREQHWRGILSDWKASGLSISAFCRTRDVSEASFYTGGGNSPFVAVVSRKAALRRPA